MIWLLWLLACTPVPDAPLTDDTDATDTDDTDVPDTDTDTGDSGQDTDDGCSLGVSVGDTPLSTGDSAAFPTAPAMGPKRELTLHLSNACTQPIRFLGFPDDWITDSGFTVETLPPVLISPGEEAMVVLAYQPRTEGTAQGTFVLPYDRPSSPFSLTVTAEITPPLRLVLVGDGRMAMTENYGETFTETQLTTEVHSNELRRGVCWGLNQFIATGGSNTRNIWTSPDGRHWTHTNQDYGWVADCAGTEDTVITAGGFHTLAVTEDLTDWHLERHSGDHFRTVAYGDGVYVATGAGEAGVSTDGQTWTSLTTIPAPQTRHVAFGNGTFVAVGDAGWIVASSDRGQTWTGSQISSGNFGSIVFNGIYFYAGDAASIFRSADGLTWDRINASNGIIPRAALGTRLYGTGNGGFYISEDDGFSWTHTYTFTHGSGFNDAVFEGEPQ